MTEPEIELTDDGSATLRHPIFRDTYHSLRGAIGEARHVFIANGLAALQKERTAILETGFGSGLNAWLTLCYGRQHGIEIDYRSVELYPISSSTAGSLGYTSDPLFTQLHECGWNETHEISPGFSLTKYREDFTKPDAGWETFTCDLVYFDAFAPATQPEMWSEEIFRRIHARIVPGGMLVTYSAKGTVKQVLRNAGFSVRRLPGALGKRHMLQATKSMA